MLCGLGQLVGGAIQITVVIVIVIVIVLGERTCPIAIDALNCQKGNSSAFFVNKKVPAPMLLRLYALS